jgi:ABC-type multidrug transport system ATPase subunit
METMTPREIFEFSAACRLPRNTTPEARKKAVEDTIDNLKLPKCADTQVGGLFKRGLSGGERKRTSIGMEL